MVINPDLTDIENLLSLLEEHTGVLDKEKLDFSIVEVLNNSDVNSEVLITNTKGEDTLSRPILLRYNRISLIDILNKYPIPSISDNPDIEIMKQYCITQLGLVNKDITFSIIDTPSKTMRLSALPSSYLYIGSIDIPIS